LDVHESMDRRRTLAMAAAGAILALLAACGGGDSRGAAPPAGPAPAATAGASASGSTGASPGPDAAPEVTAGSAPGGSGGAAQGAPVVVLDPGHDGGNAAHPGEINRPVPAGRGQTKPCNTTGTSTGAGYPEHAFTWDVAMRVRQALTAKGITVVTTRPDDTGVGPCVNDRAALANRAGAVAVVSIHADGSERAGAHGFHVAYSAPPLNEAQGAPSLGLARGLRDALRAAGFSPANYLGSDGLAPRNDLAGLNLSTRPAALVECGNMRDAREAAVLSSPEGRQRYADAITAAVLGYLGR
jgi:N-acetylmuramoyl-L-alanine amidase